MGLADVNKAKSHLAMIKILDFILSMMRGQMQSLQDENNVM
jgi:hypothetical protein